MEPENIIYEERKNVNSRSLSIAIPLTLNDGKMSEKSFAYLPVWDSTGLPFMINADVLLTSNRTGIKTDEAWNN